MRSFKGLLVLLASILLSLSYNTSASSVESQCQIVPDNTYIGDPTNCAGWALCNNHLPQYLGQCANGQLFNSQKGICDYSDEVTCAVTNVNSMCAGLNGVYKSSPINCQGYCYCQNGVAQCSVCPFGLIFNPLSTSCVASSAYTCADSSPCALVQNNVLVQDVNSCSSYYRCSNGVSIAETCAGGLLFNSNKGACDIATNVVCANNSSTAAIPSPPLPPSPSSPSTPAPPSSPPSPPSVPSVPSPPSPPSIGGDNTPSAGTSSICAGLSGPQQLMTDGSTCQGYFNCFNGVSTVQPVYEECPNGTHFSQALQQCVHPYLVVCPYNRCEGLSYTFVTALNTNCMDYYVCNNGATKIYSEARCPQGFPYFDEFRQACIPSKPSYAVCN